MVEYYDSGYTSNQYDTTTPNKRFSFSELMANPNFQNMLAGIGAGLDPEGPGGAIGNATIAYNQSRVQEKTIADKEKERQAYKHNLISGLGGLTPDSKAGVRSFKENSDGSYTIQYDPPNNLKDSPVAPTTAGQPSGTGQTSAPTPSGARMSNQFPFYPALK